MALSEKNQFLTLLEKYKFQFINFLGNICIQNRNGSPTNSISYLFIQWAHCPDSLERKKLEH